MVTPHRAESYLASEDSGATDPPRGTAAIGADWVRQMKNDLPACRCLPGYRYEKFSGIHDKAVRRK